MNLYSVNYILFKLMNIKKRYSLGSIEYKTSMVTLEGFEPSTPCLEGRCSIQLSYRAT